MGNFLQSFILSGMLTLELLILKVYCDWEPHVNVFDVIFLAWEGMEADLELGLEFLQRLKRR